LGFLGGGYFGGLCAQHLPGTGLAQGVWNFAGNHWHPATTVAGVIALSIALLGKPPECVSPLFASIFRETRSTVIKMIK